MQNKTKSTQRDPCLGFRIVSCLKARNLSLAPLVEKCSLSLCQPRADGVVTWHMVVTAAPSRTRSLPICSASFFDSCWVPPCGERWPSHWAHPQLLLSTHGKTTQHLPYRCLCCGTTPTGFFLWCSDCEITFRISGVWKSIMPCWKFCFVLTVWDWDCIACMLQRQICIVVICSAQWLDLIW